MTAGNATLADESPDAILAVWHRLFCGAIA
jgi:hypothetical protein